MTWACRVQTGVADGGRALSGRCGALIDQGPYLKKVEKGMDPAKAWEQSRNEIEKKTVYGTWKRDYFLMGPDNSGDLCHLAEIKCPPPPPRAPAPCRTTSELAAA